MSIFVIDGKEDDLHWVHQILNLRYIVKVRALVGPEIRDDQGSHSSESHCAMESDLFDCSGRQKHAQQIVRDLELLDTCNGTKTPGSEQRLDG